MIQTITPPVVIGDIKVYSTESISGHPHAIDPLKDASIVPDQHIITYDWPSSDDDVKYMELLNDWQISEIHTHHN